ncbi:MAG TPA: enoyl-CoA hydratase/isomerase family protein [Solirubrobacteraceae bacterium]|jgi:2-(1,2-epoxy-1,2-dihydrophenyl)acetyl-CoA isomerase|nr:enoyl-CoA hydratase/isomerase family protein [Solirubrobacteraceae bacterium]
MADDQPLVLSERDAGTLILRLNRPDRLNAVSWALDEALAQALRAAGPDESVRAVVITGEGRAFSAGGDIRDQAARKDWTVVERHERSAAMLDHVQVIWDFPKPLIAAMNGVAAGAGAGLALLCDIRIGTPDTRVGFPFGRVGLGPDWGVSYTLPRVIGPGHAARLLFTAGYVEAEEALRLGLIDQIVPAEELLDAVKALCAEIAERAPLGVRLAKEGLRRSALLDLPAVLRTEFLGQQMAMSTEDHQQAAAAFAEKRPISFHGR